MNFGNNLQALRKAKSISQEKLAEELEISRQAIGKWESGTVYPDAERLVQISEYFGVSIDQLIKGTVEISDSKPEHLSENVSSSHRYQTLRTVIAIALLAISPFFPGKPGAGTMNSFFMILCIASGIALLVFNHLSKKHGR